MLFTNNNRRKQFEKLFQPHIDAAYNLARYLCGNAYDAEDIVQEAYLRAYRAFSDYKNDNARAWILTITRNTCYSWIRKNNININVPFDEEINSTENLTLISDSAISKSPEQMLENHDIQSLVRQAIKSLPIEFREVAVLRELEGLSYHEIGLILDIPKGTVMSRIARARSRLRDLLVNPDQQEKP